MAELMTVEEVASYLRVNKKTIYTLISESRIPATRVGRQYRFNKAAIDDWLHEKSIGGKISILIIDDEETIRSLFKETLEELGHNVVAVGASSEGLELLKQQDFDLVFLDLKMPVMDGAELFHQIKVTKPKLPVIIITGYPDSDMMIRALAHGPFGVMNKPFSESDIVKAVQTFARLSSEEG